MMASDRRRRKGGGGRGATRQASAGGTPLSGHTTPQTTPDLTVSRELQEHIEIHTRVIEERMTAWRRDFHRHAEAGWLEFRTASLIARTLEELGWQVAAGQAVVDAASRMGVPDPEELASAWERARTQGGDPTYLEALRGGFTGVVGTLTVGGASVSRAPVMGLRFDIDALDLQESTSPRHRPVALGFASINPGTAHACGHDAHAAMGLGVAAVLSALAKSAPELLPAGTVKLIFQPAEEGVRGARAMVVAGVLDDVDAVVALHVYSGWPVGQVACGRDGFLATDKFDAILTGEPAHAGGNPQGGKNALLAAATAALNLHALPRHRGGPTRINVGRLVAGQGRNVIPSTAYLAVETRGGTSEINDELRLAAERVIRAAAAMYDCTVEIQSMGAARSAQSDPLLYSRAATVASALTGLEVRVPEPGGGSEDFTYMMRRVQGHGGMASAMGIGADIGGFGGHTPEFDINEAMLPQAVKFLTVLTLDIFADPLTGG
jgi:aminobenzoyl-glutamate utilization protein A